MRCTDKPDRISESYTKKVVLWTRTSDLWGFFQRRAQPPPIIGLEDSHTPAASLKRWTRSGSKGIEFCT